ncbi:MAG: hypothetical protein GF368_00590 [Candidatus Aenigmarchaeota archaeon]|nr:hypothetical protein [Candidatus Aenigmarchaeota archaeon]
MRTKILITVILLTLPLIVHAEIKEEIYSDQTTHPNFFCPEDSLRCELYKTVDGMNREIDPPLLIKVCWPSTFCNYINNIGASLGFRLLPGDICLSAAKFKGYKIIEGVATTTTRTTTTTIPTTTIIEYSDCQGVNFLRCRYYSNCEWKGDPIFGHCEEKETTNTTTTKVSTTTKITNIQTTTTSTTVQTTTTVLECLSLDEKCLFDLQCCSGECKIKRSCKNLSIHGICLSYIFSKVCV